MSSVATNSRVSIKNSATADPHVIVEEVDGDGPNRHRRLLDTGPPPFRWSQLWEEPPVNPLNLKSYTLPILTLNNPYSRTFHLSWLSFFSAFLSWFAFPPLMPEAIKADLKLSAKEVANSNVIALTSTLLARLIIGPFVDRVGPRKTMATILLLGAIASGLAGTATDATTLYVIRFFIGILGASFVPCQAWTSVFFDKNCVGTANALVGGWGNLGGGATFAIMVSVYSALTSGEKVSQHNAWRAAFAIVPVPVLICVAGLVLFYGQDHPAGKWAERHSLAAATTLAHENIGTHAATEADLEKSEKLGYQSVSRSPDIDTIDLAINEELTARSAIRLVLRPVTWLPGLAYLTTFGLELAIDGQMATILFGLFNKRIPGFDQTKAGYYTSIFGFLNFVTRPLGGYIGDLIYRPLGTTGKKFWTLGCGVIMGISFLVGGIYLENNPLSAKLATIMGVFAISAIFSELGNGANFALVPHCNANHNGVTTGLVGSLGNLGGIIFGLIYRFQTDAGKACWIIGTICIVVNVLLALVPVPAH